MRKRVLAVCLVVVALLLQTPFTAPVRAKAGPEAWLGTGPLNTGRLGHTATLLPDGRVLVAGGWVLDVTGTPRYLASTEVYDPAGGAWRPGTAMGMARGGHTATLLPNGRVLVIGGDGDALAPSSAEVFDPATATWAPAGSLADGRVLHTATLLADGRVLVAGGIGPGGLLASAELYEPVSGAWSTTGSLVTGRDGHTATLLPDGRVLVVGGHDDSGFLASVEVYDPVLGTWSQVEALNTERWYHTATLLVDGQVLVAGGFGIEGALADAQLYNPVAAPGSAWSPAGVLDTARGAHTATLLPDGSLLVAGGDAGSGSIASTEVYDPAAGEWSPASLMGTARLYHTATLLPNGRVLVAGGQTWQAGEGLPGAVASAELYDGGQGSWIATGSMAASRSHHSVTLLPDGQVLAAGGYGPDGAGGLASNQVELYQPGTGAWTEAGTLQTARAEHSATTLPGGQVLVAGGWSGEALGSAEIYDPQARRWSITGSMGTARRRHTATLLADGRVLVAGGDNGQSQLSGAEVYDPVAGKCTATAEMETARTWHSATLLPNGQVLMIGGRNETLGWLSSAQIYDPAGGTWHSAGSMAGPRGRHTATLLPNGRVLVCGGTGSGDAALASAEVYDPASDTWITVGSMAQAREGHQAILLPNGMVLAVGGLGAASAETYDPATGTWSPAAPPGWAAAYAGLTLLADGRLLRTGGWSGDAPAGTAELYDRGPGLDPAWRPTLLAVSSPLLPGTALTLQGSGFRGYGLTEASNGTTGNSATNYPLVQLRRLDNSEVSWLLPDSNRPFSATEFTALPVAGLPGGPYLVTVLVNGIDSVSQMITASETDRPPIAHNDDYVTDKNVPLLVAAPGVLFNDFDSDLPAQGLTAAPSSGPDHGDLVLNPDGSFLYTPDQGFTGPDAFVYRVSDGESSSTAVVSLTVGAGSGPGSADLALAKTASAPQARPGGMLTYTLAVTNTGPSEASGITVTDRLSPAVSLLAASRDCSTTGPVVVCLPRSLHAGDHTTLTLTVRINITATGILTNTALITAAEPDSEPANNTAWTAVPVVRPYNVYLPLAVKP